MRCSAANAETWVENKAVDVVLMLLIAGARKARSVSAQLIVLTDVRACARAHRGWLADGDRLHWLVRGFTGVEGSGEREQEREQERAARDEMRFQS